MSQQTKKTIHRNLVVYLLITAATLCVYWQVGSHDFINYDDPLYVTKNTHVQAGLTWAGLRWALSTGHASNWHPITWLSHMIDVEFFGLQPGGPHLVNLFFHILNTWILLFVLNKMTGSFWRSSMVAALFALHPLHAESVAWIAERKDVLSTFFGFLSLWAYTRFIEKKTIGRHVSVLICFALSLTAKPMLVTLPFVLLLLDYWPLNRYSLKEGNRGQWLKELARFSREKSLLFLLSAFSCIVTYLVQEHGPAVQSLAQIPLGVRVVNAIVSYGTYLFKTLWPMKMAVYYPHPHDRLSIWLPIVSLALLIGVSVFLLIERKRRPYGLVGWLWFLGTLVPVIGLVQVGGQAMADRYTYIPLVGVFIAVTWAVGDIVERRPSWKKISAVGACLGIFLLGAATWKQLGYWKDSMTLFSHALSVTANNQLAHNQMGFALNKKGKYDEAIIHLREALRITPQYVGAYINLGNALKEIGDLTDAARQYQEALRYDPYHVTAMNNLGILFAMKGQLEKSMALFSEALKIDPKNVRAHNNMGIALAKQGDLKGAEKYFLEALRLDPYSELARKNLERVQRSQR